MEVTRLPLSKVALNQGQIEGLPANPRQWTQTDIDTIAASLNETPELFEMRPLIVARHESKYIILAGSLRFCGARKNGAKEVPAIVVPEDMSVAKMREIVIKDNGAFGAWDYDALGNEWDDLPLTAWGVPAWQTEDEQEGESNKAQEDDFDEDSEPIAVVCKKGDIWQLGDHRLMCGDSVELEEVKKLMGGGYEKG